LCLAAIGARQLGHCERGLTIDSPRGRRWITTFRNEPTASPSAKAKTSAGPMLSKVAIRSEG
jgi:hypothetical protein